MSAPTPLLQNAWAFARDFPRDQMPKQYMWDIVDYVPVIIDANLTGRGGWVWGSGSMNGDAMSGIVAAFPQGEQLLVASTANTWYVVSTSDPFPATSFGSCTLHKQNPIQGGLNVFAFDGIGASVPQVLSSPSGAAPTIANMHATAPKAKYGTYYNDMVVVGGTPGEDNVVRFSIPANPLNAWDSNSTLGSNKPITGMGALRAAILVFHNGSTERIRGQVPDRSTGKGDMKVEPLFDRVGCGDARSIAYWQDNCVFADEHGVHMTDGAVIRNLCSQGAILYYWRMLYANQISVAGNVFLDYYQVTIRRSDGSATTLICDLNRRQWYRFSNVYALSYIASSGTTGMERIYAGMAGTNRLARMSPMYFPITTGNTVVNADADGKPVLPVFETAWYQMGRMGRKRTRFAYLTYDMRTTAAVAAATKFDFPAELEGERVAPAPAAIMPMVSLSRINHPADASYTAMGNMPPSTHSYTRFKLPVSGAHYGIGFKVTQLQASTVTRVYNLEVDELPLEPSRL